MDALRFDWQSGTDPYFAMVPMTDASWTIEPRTAPPSTLALSNGVLVDDFYGGGFTSVPPGGGLAYTAINDDGTVSVDFVPPSADGADFGSPVEVASPAGVAGVALTELADGSWISAWSEVATPGALDSDTELFFATSPDGETWSEPTSFASSGYASGLQLVATGDVSVLAWYEASEALAETQTLRLAVVDASGPKTTYDVVTNTAVRDFALAGALGDSAEATILVQQMNGTVEAYTWTETGVSAATPVAEQVLTGNAASYDSSGRVVAVAARDGELMRFRRGTGGNRSPLGEPLGGVAPGEANVLATDIAGEPGYLVAWTTEDTLGYASFTALGELAEGPTLADADAGYRLGSIALSEVPTEPPSFRVTAIGDQDRASRLVEYIIVPGDGIVAPGDPEPTGSGGSGAGGAGPGGAGGETANGGRRADGGANARAGTDAGGATDADGGSDDRGCGCRTAGHSGRDANWALLLGLAALGRRRRDAARGSSR